MLRQEAPVQCALIGLGTHAKIMAQAMQQVAGVALVGVVSHSESHAQAFAAQFGVPNAATSLAALCERITPDALLICSPNDRHAMESREAIHRGIPVLCEKPMALLVAEAAQVAADVARTRVPYGVGFHLRFHPLIRRAHEWVCAERLGTLQALEAHWSTGKLGESTLTPLTNAHKQWREIMAQSGGGASQARGVHLYDLIRHLTGIHMTHISALHNPHSADLPDHTSMSIIRGASSFLASVTTSRLIPASQERLVLHGSHGTLELIDAFRPDGMGTLRFIVGRERKEEVVAHEPRNLYGDEIAAFAAAVRGAPWTGATAADGLAVTAMVEAEWRSVRSERTESVDATSIS